MIDYLNAARLDGSAIVLLGAGGGGIGNATARALYGAGARVLCVDIDEQQAKTAAAESGGDHLAADIRQRSEMARIFEHAQSLYGAQFRGIVDIVAVGLVAPLETLDDETLDWQFDLVFRHALLAVQLGAPFIAENGGGTITLVGSRAGIKPVAQQGVYGAMKAAVHHLVRCAAAEYGPMNIRINSVAPGFVLTPRVRAALPEAEWPRVAAINPLRRIAVPEDVARAILYLSSDLSSYLTGNVLNLDGAGDNPLAQLGLKLALPTR